MPSLTTASIEEAFIAGDGASTTTEKGNKLVDVIKYVLERIPGVTLQDTSVLTANGSEELDAIFWNDKLEDGLPFLPDLLLFECKNWQRPVDSESVSFFLSKLEERHLQYGFLIAANGVTGDPAKRSAAQAQIDSHFLRHDRRLIVIERRELSALTHTDDFVRLIKRKISKIVLRVQSF